MKHTIITMAQKVLLILLWGIFLFLQHVACFDVFDSNLWYLYVLALLFAYIQYALIIFLSRHFSCKHLLWVLASIYVFLSLAKLMQIILRSNYESYNMGLTIICLILDMLGSLITFFRLPKA